MLIDGSLLHGGFVSLVPHVVAMMPTTFYFARENSDVSLRSIKFDCYFPSLLPPPEAPPDVFCPDPMDGTQLTDASLDRLGFA